MIALDIGPSLEALKVIRIGTEGASVEGRIVFQSIFKRRAQDRTPVDTGNLRGSWFTSRGAPSDEELPYGAGFHPLQGEDAVHRILSGMDPREDTFETNTARHAQAVLLGRRVDKNGRAIGSVQHVLPVMPEALADAITEYGATKIEHEP